jgi:hypothetical protein
MHLLHHDCRVRRAALVLSCGAPKISFASPRNPLVASCHFRRAVLFRFITVGRINPGALASAVGGISLFVFDVRITKLRHSQYCLPLRYVTITRKHSVAFVCDQDFIWKYCTFPDILALASVFYPSCLLSGIRFYTRPLKKLTKEMHSLDFFPARRWRRHKLAKWA